MKFDSAKVSKTVAAGPAAAFEVFTTGIDLWWRRGPKFRVSGLGGRLMETFETPSGPRVAVMGRITAWDPPARFAFEWRAANFTERDPGTTVEVTFELANSGTRVTVRHSGWAAVRGDHPVRHGLDGDGFTAMLGLWWGDLMTSLREHLAAK